MRPEHLRHLVDPLTKQPLQLKITEQSGPHVMTGTLHNGQNSYPIIYGIPRLMPGQSGKPASFAEHQEKTADSFSFEWNNIYQENTYEKQNFLHFLSPFIKEDDLVGNKLLDVGCGSGRFTKQAALAGAKIVIATDHGLSVEAAFKLTQDLPNACIVQADIYHMPVKNFADLTFSIGVLHHLPNPEAGFRQLKNTAMPNGRVLIWVYNRRHNFRAVYLFETMRRLTRHLPKTLLYRFGYLPAAGVEVANYFTRTLSRVGAAKLAKKIPFSYYANFPFSMKINDAFDVFATPKSNYYYVEEIEAWFRRAGLNNIKSHEHPEAGITCLGSLQQPGNVLEHVRQLNNVAVTHNLGSQ
jgi:SAM-dependent methyltransferase